MISLRRRWRRLWYRVESELFLGLILVIAFACGWLLAEFTSR